ncbi:MAG: aminomethyl-transferring glycine dehydrogenase [Bacteroidetes bacterium]|nr:aminomethyl-transferring glycine dehydrogenase [Bacteroidota bacterium]
MDFFEQESNEFASRHIGPNEAETKEMLAAIGIDSMDELLDKTIPKGIRIEADALAPVGNAMSEYEYLKFLSGIAKQNNVFKSYIGQGYYGTIVPSVILRNLFENPGWYTQYTPYQAEIAQGRLESLLNFQTMVSDLTALPIANASLLDEGTAAAEAMAMLFNHKNKNTDHITSGKFFVDEKIFAQTKDLLITRSKPVGIELVFGDFKRVKLDDSFFGAIVQYPNNEGSIVDYHTFVQEAHQVNVMVVMATDLLALTLLKAPGELGADVAIGSSQRFGVPMGYGGPHAAFFATKDEFKRNIPGRIIGVSIDANDNRALRMALQTREQHIRREKATSNICTAQALLANMAAMYAVYHGSEGLRNIASRIHFLTCELADKLSMSGIEIINDTFFDTITLKINSIPEVKKIAEASNVNFFYSNAGLVSISIDETTTRQDIQDIAALFGKLKTEGNPNGSNKKYHTATTIPEVLIRSSAYLLHPVFNKYHSESEMMRYLKRLENKDLSLVHSMISLGSCTMKLNAATELIPVSWPEFANIHPFAPEAQTAGYNYIINDLENLLSTITGFYKCSLQPNSGAQGEFAGLLAIMRYHESKNEAHRNVILIPISAHGTNPASAVMAGMKVVVTKCDEQGNIDIEDLRMQAQKNKESLAGLMVTYPSTHGVFEEGIKEICDIVHENGGLVYMDGANMNAQVGYSSPGFIGADVCHLNLHKTFAIPHGGGGPGMGPICVNERLAPFLPGSNNNGAVSAARFGSASILLISYAYIKMLGQKGLRNATAYAILNANYMKAKLKENYKILFTGVGGTCAHEFIVDLRPYKSAGIEAEDIAKRLMDYGFHAPTLSFPVAGTIMIEPTESENKEELDRFCEALNKIFQEIKNVENGNADKKDNVLKNAPHTLAVITADAWSHSYSRSDAAFPLPYLIENKFWPAVSRVNNTYGDRNLVCTCEPIESYLEA